MLDRLFVPWRDAWVLHLDDDLLVIDKPAGVSTHGAEEGQVDDAVSRLQAWWRRTHEDPPLRLGVHQRLDRDTSGVLVFSRSRAASRALAAAFEGRAVDKRYVACVESAGLRADRGTLTHDLAPDGEGGMRATPPSPKPRGQRAVTRYTVLARVGGHAMIEFHPETGRTHQIRVQAAAAGFPLAGDARYGGPVAPRLMLHATSLTVPHPAHAAPRTFTSAAPSVFDDWLHARDDRATWPARIASAADRRWFLGSDPETTAFRLLHTGDGGDDVAVDLYGEHALVHVYGAAMPEGLPEALLAAGVRGVYAKFRPKQANTLVDTRRDEVAPKRAVAGDDAPDEFEVRERGLRYLVRLGDGLSTGIFLDMRETRQRVRALAAGASVLNLFAYCGPFTVAAAAGGATRTVSVDVSQGSMAWARRNLAANGLDDPRHVTVTADVFPWMDGARARRDRFDLVIADPPSYATTRDSRFSAGSDYGRLAAQAYALVAPGGKLLACSNHKGLARMKLRRQLHEAARAAGREVLQMKDLPPPEDFPPAPGEEPHLKCVLVTVR